MFHSSLLSPGARAARMQVHALLLCAPVMALAQSDPSALALAPVVVTATRVEQPLTDLVADVSVIGRDQIERSGADGLVGLLARQPGIEISRNGGPGGVSSVFLRGAESRFTAVYIDGVRVDSQATGGATWEAIPLALIDHIEILRGPAAAVYGSDAIGGVVQLFTRKGEGAARPFAGIGAGSYGLRRAEAGVSGASGDVDYAIGAAWEQSQGFNARPGPGSNPDRDGYRRQSATAKLGWRIDDQHRLDLNVLENEMNSGYDDFFYDPLRPVDDRGLYHLRTAGLTWTAQWTAAWRMRASVTDSNSRYETTPSAYIAQTRLRSYLLQNDWTLGAHRISATLERREDKFYNPALDAYSSTIDARRAQDALALGYGYRQGAHTVQLNVRHDRDSDFGGKTTGSAAYGYALDANWRITASAGTAFRAPTLYQRYSQYGVAGLQPETGRNLEAGLRYGAGASTASLVLYRNTVRNLIGFDGGATDCASFFGCYANVGRARYEGATLAGSHRIGDWTLRGSVDVQDPRDLETGRQLARRARRHATLAADWRVGIWTLGAEWQASSRRYDDAANKNLLPGYAVVNLVASAVLTPALTLQARLDNVADKSYQLARGFATAGRSFYVGLKWQPR